MSIKRGLLLFWALWFSVVVVTNVTDGMKALGLLPDTWPLASGNYAFIGKVMSIYSPPTALGRLVALDVKGLPLRRQWSVAHPQDKRLGPAAVAFKAFLLTSAEVVLASTRRPAAPRRPAHG